ncbi:MAG: GNAT family N-acetyltransferase [bacterium]|nr:GNAT family N-acetyltransferase [bacterium]
MIRDFRPEDQSAVRQLILDGLRERWGEAYSPAFNPDLDDIHANYLDQGAEVVVIDDGAEILATGILLREQNQRGRIVRMSVDSRHRQRGLGRQVIEELVDRAKRQGMHELVVLADTPWTSAVALYRACGFRELASDETDTHFAMHL